MTRGTSAIIASTGEDRFSPCHIGFVGVSTAGSSITKVFPRWMDLLGRPELKLIGHDLPLSATNEEYRSLITAIRADQYELGALVTTHKLGVYRAASDLFDELDEFAVLYREVSSISKRGGRLVGKAKDPITARLAMEEFLPERYFSSSGAEVVCLGSGGAGTAITSCLAARQDRPRKIMCTDRRAEALEALRRTHDAAGLSPVTFGYELTSSAAQSDELIGGAAPGSLVVNATGLGKDLPGSPVTGDVRFPTGGIVWDLNYRGPLRFLEDARRQASGRSVTVIDGWRYFIHGWTQFIGEVLEVEIVPNLLTRLSMAAEGAR